MSNSSIITFAFWPWWAALVWRAWGSSLGIGVGVITRINNNSGARLFLPLLLLLFPPCLPLLIRHLIIGCLFFTFYSTILILSLLVVVGWLYILVFVSFITGITFFTLINWILWILLIIRLLNISGRLSPLNGEPCSDTNWKDLKMPRGGVNR